MSDRRDFLKGTVAAGVVAKFGNVAQAANSSGIPIERSATLASRCR